ncbi:MAG: hypothetical protein LBN20_00005, partial [Endomicrobium sp.]|nr:hypothetical protein [Endomicrobium sp.]
MKNKILKVSRRIFSGLPRRSEAVYHAVAEAKAGRRGGGEADKTLRYCFCSVIAGLTRNLRCFAKPLLLALFFLFAFGQGVEGA